MFLSVLSFGILTCGLKRVHSLLEPQVAVQYFHIGFIFQSLMLLLWCSQLIRILKEQLQCLSVSPVAVHPSTVTPKWNVSSIANRVDSLNMGSHLVKYLSRDFWRDLNRSIGSILVISSVKRGMVVIFKARPQHLVSSANMVDKKRGWNKEHYIQFLPIVSPKSQTLDSSKNVNT